MKLLDVLERVERRLVYRALKATQGNRALAAELLGIHRTTLVEKIKRHELLESVGPSPRDNRLKTHCPRGHAYDADNTYLVGEKNYRRCAACQKAKRQLKIAALKAQANLCDGAQA